MQHFFFSITCEDGREIECDLISENQVEAEKQLHSIDTIGFTRLENNQMTFHTMKSFRLLKITDPHDDVSPQLWKTYNIAFTTYDDMIQRQEEYCRNHFESHKQRYSWDESHTLKDWTVNMCHSVAEAWGKETPETLARKERKLEWERQYSKHAMTPGRYKMRGVRAKHYAKTWNDWLYHGGTLGKYDKWTFQEMLDGSGYGHYTNINGELVVTPCYDDEMPELDENKCEIDSE